MFVSVRPGQALHRLSSGRAGALVQCLFPRDLVGSTNQIQLRHNSVLFSDRTSAISYNFTSTRAPSLQRFHNARRNPLLSKEKLTISARAMSSEAISIPPVVCRLSKPLPDGTIDSHNHIIPPDFDRFPTVSTAEYKPKPHTISDARKFYTQTSGLGISTPRMVLTQISVYGHDNSALLFGVEDLGENGRGVVECSPDVPIEQLEQWWQCGIRGVRINLVSVGRTVVEPELHRMLQAYVDKLGEMSMSDASKKWMIDLHFPLGYMTMLLSVLQKIAGAERVRWCVDHFGGLKFKNDAPNFGPGDDPYAISGVKELVTLITDQGLPEVYVKLSAAYRVDPDYPSETALKRLGAVGCELVRQAEDRVIWATDWPHTRFENVDSVPFVEACYEWCGQGEEGERRRDKLFKVNSEKLWDMA